jgi:anti-sigma-K factor RskA
MIDERHEESAALYAFDLLDGVELAQFKAALARDPALQALVQELRESSAALAHTALATEPPAELRARLLAEVADRAKPGTPNSKLVFFPTWLPWLAAACFAASTAWFVRLYLTSHSEAALLRDEQTLADIALRSARTQLETERLLSGRQRASLDRQLADTTRRLTDTTDRLMSTDRLLAAARSQLADERAATSERLATLDQQLAALQSKSGDTARQLEAARKLLAAQDAALDEQAKRIAAIETQARDESDLAQFKITTLASMLKNSPQALAVAVWNPATQQGVLQVDKLPALAADKDYQLWVVDPQYPNPVDGGVFTVNAQTGAAHVQFKAKQTVHAINAFAVTLERKGGVAKAEGPFVLLGK